MSSFFYLFLFSSFYKYFFFILFLIFEFYIITGEQANPFTKFLTEKSSFCCGVWAAIPPLQLLTVPASRNGKESEREERGEGERKEEEGERER